MDKRDFLLTGNEGGLRLLQVGIFLYQIGGNNRFEFQGRNDILLKVKYLNVMFPDHMENYISIGGILLMMMGIP